MNSRKCLLHRMAVAAIACAVGVAASSPLAAPASPAAACNAGETTFFACRLPPGGWQVAPGDWATWARKRDAARRPPTAASSP
jgi:hypothetical protein